MHCYLRFEEKLPKVGKVWLNIQLPTMGKKQGKVGKFSIISGQRFSSFTKLVV
jgi:hypothetical protein